MNVWINGELFDEHDARISPFDHGFTVGDGVFETVRIYGGHPFAWQRHINRLHASARALGLTVPDGIRSGADAVLAANGLEEARMRITVTAGPAPLGSERGDAEPTAVIALGPAVRPTQPARVATTPWPRNELGALTGLKTTSYAENVRSLAYARAHDCDEALLLNTNGAICEGTATNVFVAMNETVITPPLASGCLAGVTRAIVIELCEQLGIPCEERTILPTELVHAEEAFLTGSVREVQGIAAVDDQQFVAPGPITARITKAFHTYIESGVE
ncbi:MAG: aminotransferase class IV [Acidimicrobiia bacterium]